MDNKYMLLYRRLRLWAKLVWREWEPASCGIPEPYRSKYRFDAPDAWQIATIIHPSGDSKGANAGVDRQEKAT